MGATLLHITYSTFLRKNDKRMFGVNSPPVACGVEGKQPSGPPWLAVLLVRELRAGGGT